MKTLIAPARVKVIPLGTAKVGVAIPQRKVQPQNYDYFTREIVEDKLNDLRREKGLKLEDIKVISVEKEKRPELKLPPQAIVQEAKALALIEIPMTIHRKVLDAIRTKLWDRGEGIAVRFEVNRHLPSSKISAEHDYFQILEEEKV